MSSIRLLVVVPFPMPAEQIALRERQSEEGRLPSNVTVEYRAVRAAPTRFVSAYDSTIADLCVLEAGQSAERDGFDAVCVDTVSDAGVDGLRSLLDIPVVGAGQSMFTLASTLGRTFGVVAMWDRWFPLYRKVLDRNGLVDRCVGMRDLGEVPNTRNLLEGKSDLFPKMAATARGLVDEDDADVICLGSTTMHQSHDYLKETLDVPVLNPGPLSYRIAHSMVTLGLSHSTRAYPAPDDRLDEALTAMASAAASTMEARK